MSRYPTGIDDEVFTVNLRAYRQPPRTYDLLIRNHFEAEASTTREYQGRELYELLQNADDAGAKNVSIRLEGNTLTITNDGGRPFTTDGYGSIMRDKQSTKDEGRYIGCKGLGFRAVLNWTSSIIIRSLAYPGASYGYECRFSQSIAERTYKSIREYWGDTDPAVDAILERVSAKYGGRAPVAVLAVPEVTSWIPGSGVTTEVALDVTDDILPTIRGSLSELLDSQFLIFLHSIRHIRISVEGAVTYMELRRIEANRYDIAIGKSDGSTTVQQWLIESIDEDKISVAAARRVDAGSVGESRHDYLFHSFFPTKIRTGYGFVIHATVELDNSRNHILGVPDRVNELLEDVVVALVGHFTDKHSWDACDILYNTEERIASDVSLGAFAARMAALRQRLRIVPTAGGTCESIADSIVLSDSFSNYAVAYVHSNKELERVALPGFAEAGVSVNIERHIESLRAHAASALSVEQRTALTVALMQDYGRLGGKKLSLLTAGRGAVCKEKCYLVAGRKNKLPAIVKVPIVDYDLTEHLLRALHDAAERYDPEEKKPERRLARYLSNITEVSYTDFKVIKSQVLEASALPRTREQEVELIRYLYKEWRESGEALNLPTKPSLHLLDLQGESREASSLIAWSNSGPWAPLINDPADFPGEDEEEKRRFAIGGLGLASHVPLRLQDWGEAEDYLRAVAGEDTGCYRRSEVSKSADANYRLAAVVDVSYVRSHEVAELIKALLSDDRAYRAVVPASGHFLLHYYWYGLKAQAVRLSPAAYLLKTKLGFLEDYILDTGECLSGKNVKLRGVARGEQGDRFRALARLYGAKESMREADAEKLYRLVSEVPAEGHRERYQYFKDIFGERLDSGEKFAPPQDLKVWCKDGDALRKMTARDCYYCNDGAPTAILGLLPVFDIGPREGEDLVGKVFGVRRFSDIRISVDEADTEELADMSENISRLIRRRHKALLLTRCAGIKAQTSRTVQMRTQWKALAGLRIHAAAKVAYRTEGVGTDAVHNLSEHEFIVDGRGEYWYCTERCNPGKDRNVIESIAVMLCHLFKLEGKKRVKQLFFILKSDEEDLEFRNKNDYSETYIKEIEAVMSGDTPVVEEETRIHFEDLWATVNEIQTHRVGQRYLECCTDKSLQRGFFSSIPCIEDKMERECLEAFTKLNIEGADIEEIRAALRARFISGAAMGRPKVCADYNAWISGHFASNYEVQQYPELHSLTYFPGNEEEIERLWEEMQAGRAHRAESGKNDHEPLPVQVVTGGRLEMPREADGQQTKLRKGGGHRSDGSGAERGKKAEETVYDWLRDRGYDVRPRSSALDPSIRDVYHYDMEYEDEQHVRHYVEVKSKGDGTLHFSEQEYAFAKRHAANYDLYVVDAEKVMPFERAFEELERKAIPERYKIRVS